MFCVSEINVCYSVYFNINLPYLILFYLSILNLRVFLFILCASICKAYILYRHCTCNLYVFMFVLFVSTDEKQPLGYKLWRIYRNVVIKVLYEINQKEVLMKSDGSVHLETRVTRGDTVLHVMEPAAS